MASVDRGMRDVQQLLGALTSPVRRQILALIWDRHLPASEIAAAFEVTASTVSEHLAILREAGLVTMTARGNFRLYRTRQEVLRSLHGVLGGTSPRWTAADDLPERAFADAETRAVVVAQVDVDTDQAATFRAFTDGDIYSRWMGVPVRIEDGRFSCTLEWGTRVEGVYDVVSEPDLIALRWDFDDDNVPIPGGAMVGYLRFAPLDHGCHVEVHQLIDAPEHAGFMEAAWTMVFGRLKAGVVAAVGDGRPAQARPRRPKRRDGARPA
jgi:DNA-binding transcriptional ArsR family regulator